MTSMSESEIVGADLEWYACDARGNVAFLTSFLNDRLPVSIACDAEGFQLAEEYFCQLPITCDAILVRQDCGDQLDWEKAAQRGMFAFDSSRQGLVPGYELVAKPAVPINISDIGPDIGAIVSRTRVLFCFDEIVSVTDDSVFGEMTRGASVDA